jgi:glycosyltransferase involved in cell wall biosynthesis
MLTRRPAHDHGGVERVVRGLLEEIPRLRPEWRIEAVAAFRGAGPLEGFDGLSDVVAALRMGWTARRHRADVILVHCPECVWGLRLLAGPRALARTVVVWHGAGPVPYLVLRPEGNRLARALAWFRTSEERLALPLRQHVAVHRVVVDELAAAYGHHGPVDVIPNAMDLRGRRPSVRGKGPGRPFTVAWVGQADLRKGLDVALEAVRRLRVEVPDARLLVAGVPAGATEPGVEWLGVLPPERVTEVYASADVFCFPTRYESYGLVVVEAMAAGLPVVVSDAVPPGIVTPANGWVVPGHDAGPYAEVLLRLAGDRDLLDRISRHNAVDVERFSLAAAAASWVELIERVTGADSGSVPVAGRPGGD